MTGPRYTGKPGKIIGFDEMLSADGTVELTDEQLEKAKGLIRPRKEVQEEFVPGATTLAPYRPNRHQRRLQERARKLATKRRKK